MYEIIGKRNGKIEVIDECDTEFEANFLVGEYLMAFGSDWSIWWE
jgi:hypothetical protein